MEMMTVRYENFDFSFSYVFSSSLTVLSLITIKWQEKKLSIINIFNFLVSDHLKFAHIVAIFKYFANYIF